MNNDQIRQNLAGYRPELYRDDDPLIAESLRLAKADPELSQWLDEQVQFDREVTAALTAVASPPAIAVQDLLQAEREQARAGRTRRHRTLAIAALFILSLGMVGKYFLFPPAVEFAAHDAPTVDTFREQMAYFASQRFVLDRGFSSNQESAQWLAGEEFPSPDQIPGELVQYRGMGCKKLQWNERKVGLICFKNKANDIVHLFILDRTTLTESPAQASEFGKILVFHDRETMGWQDEDKSYLLVGSEPGVRLAGLM